MIVQVTNENPLTVLIDGVSAEILTYNYTEEGVSKTCKYVIADDQKIPIQWVGEKPTIP